MNNKRRLVFIDILRGIAVLNMIVYHALYDLVYLFNVNIPWFNISKAFIWEQYICFSFILISGVSFRFSRKPWKNGVKLLGFAYILTLVTVTAIPEQVVWFGVLHLLAFSILITWMIRPMLKKIPPFPGMLTSMIVFFTLKMLPQGKIGIKEIMEFQVSKAPYETPYLFWLGFPMDSFTSSDYFPIIPWIFLFLTGYFMGEYWTRFTIWMENKYFQLGQWRWYVILDRSMGIIGRKSLWIYMLHQPVIYGVLLVLAQFKMI